MFRPKPDARPKPGLWATLSTTRPRTIMLVGVGLAVVIYSLVIVVVLSSRSSVKSILSSSGSSEYVIEDAQAVDDETLPLIDSLCNDPQYRDTPECQSLHGLEEAMGAMHLPAAVQVTVAASHDDAAIAQPVSVPSKPAQGAHPGIGNQVASQDIHFFRELASSKELHQVQLAANHLELHFTDEGAIVAARKKAFKDGSLPLVTGPQRGIQLQALPTSLRERLGLPHDFQLYRLQPSIAGLYQVHSAAALRAPTQEERVSSTHDLESPGPVVFLKFVYREQMPPHTASAINALRKRIWELQNPPDCSAARISFYQLKTGMNYGIGVNTEYMVAAFARAMEQNRTFVLPTMKGPSNLAFYWAQDFCKQQSWLCYFHSISKCDESHLGVSNYMRLSDDSKDADSMARTRVIKSIACPRKDGVIAAKSMEAISRSFSPYFSADHQAPQLRGRSKYDNHGECGDALGGKGSSACLGSAMWVASYLTEFVFRPRPWLLSMFERERTGFPQGWMHPMGAMHIRKTDKLVGKLKEARDPMQTYDLEHYFAASDELANLHADFSAAHHNTFNKGAAPPLGGSSIDRTGSSGLPQVYVSTDTNTVIVEMNEKWGLPPHAPLLYFANQTRYELGAILQLRTKMGSVNQNEEAYNAIKDIWLLSEVGFVAAIVKIAIGCFRR
eukprot:INCI5126.15.p1 GENE.INCI5126.15~~INCI5126.15.p1  ORF type:complete len:671 (+),score=82.02 INCI5126.15:346-2358(+)